MHVRGSVLFSISQRRIQTQNNLLIHSLFFTHSFNPKKNNNAKLHVQLDHVANNEHHPQCKINCNLPNQSPLCYLNHHHKTPCKSQQSNKKNKTCRAHHQLLSSHHHQRTRRSAGFMVQRHPFANSVTFHRGPSSAISSRFMT